MAESKQVAATVQLVWSESDKSFKNQLNNQLIPTRLTEYDLDGRMSAVALPAVADPLNANAVTRPRYQYGYSFSGQQSLIVDPYGHETRLAFDAFGRQVSRTLPLGFGVDGKLGTTDDSAAEAFSEYEQYDSRGRKSLHISFEGVHEQNIYDDKTGRLTEIRYYPNASAFAKGTSSEVRKFSFDNRGRTNKIEHFVGGVSVRIETMAYDDEGKLYETMNREGKVRYTYDVHGRMTRKEWSSTAFMPTSQHAFENTLDYTYDELGRLKTVVQRDRGGVTLGTSDVTAYRYTLDGLLDTTRYHNGLIHDNDYDSLGRLKKLTHWVDLNADGKQQSSENRATFDYTVRADGKRTKVVESIKDGTTPVVSNEFIWEYDAVDRLISETLTDQYDLDWIYDLAGNRRTQTKSLPDGNEGYNPSEQTTYVYDSNDRLITETKTVGGGAPETNTYEYNKTQQHIESGTVDGIHTSQTVEYNLQGLLESVSVIKSNSAIRTRTSYEYDSTGTRTSSARFTRDSLGSGLWEIASRTEFLTDSENHTGYSQVLQETTYEGGVATKKVIFTVGHDQISQSTLAREAGTETWSLESDAWFGTDGHGSVRVLYDLAAAIAKDLANAARLQVYTFDAYGNLQGWPTSSLTPNTLPLTTYLYSGESFDFNIGQQYLRARFYDATTGRFNRLDPFFGNSSDPQSFHKYAYVHGDPIQGIDPTGMFLGILVGVAIGIGKSGNELLAGGLTISILKTAGQAGFDARDIGMILIARGDFDRGWMLFNLGSRIAELSFNTIDQIDSIVGTAGLVTALSFGAVAVAKNLPDIANTVADGVTKLGRMSDNLVAAARNLSKKSFNNAKYAGTLQGAMALQQRAEAINSSRRAWDVTNGTTAVIRAKNVDTGDVKVFVSTEAPTRPRQISLTSEEEYVAGIGHAEQTFFDKKGEHWIVIEGGTSRNVCRSTCAPLVEGAGLTLGGPKFAGRGDKTDYRAFWRDGE